MNSPPAPLISVRGLRHAYGEGEFERPVLHGVDVDFAPGEIAIIMGHSGSGKTTFLTLVSALRAVQAGSVRLAEHELGHATGPALNEVRRSIGFVFQRHNLIASLTARQNIQMALLLDAAPDSAAQADALLARVGLAGHEHKRPHQLSVGQQQRVAIARALARRPRIIMADEPTAALDAQTGREIIDFIQALARRDGCTVLIVTHDSRILDVADRILTLDDGRLFESGAMLERMLAEIASLVAELPRLLAWHASPTPPPTREVAELRARFARATEILNVRVSDHVRLSLRPALARRADALQQLLGIVRTFEALLAKFAAELHATPPALRQGLGDPLRQALETVLLTAADALRAPAGEDLELLERMTSDRSDTMRRVRDTRVGPEHSEADRAAVFALTNDFARLIYLLAQAAHFVRACGPVEPHQASSSER